MRRRSFPNLIGDVVSQQQRIDVLERIMRIIGFTPDLPYTLTVNDGTRNRVEVGKVGSDYGIRIVDNAGNEIILANGTIIANAIKSGTLDCDLITVANLSASVITTGTIDAGLIKAGTLNCGLITVQNLSAASITVGTFASPNDRFTTGSLSGIKLSDGTITGNKLVAYTIQADNIDSNAITTDKISAGAVIASKISVSQLSAISGNIGTIIAGSITADVINVGTLNAARIPGLDTGKIISGAYNVGGTSQPTMIYIKRSSAYADAFLRWEGGSRIWSDASNRLGVNSIGSPMYIYVDSSQRIIIPSSGQVTIEGGANLKGNFNVSDNYASHFTGEVRLDTNYISFSHASGAKLFTVNDMGLTSFKDSVNRGGLSWGNGAEIKVDQTGKWFMINGNAKEAIVPTKQGHNALYCVESPEVWFMDFCKKVNGKYNIDPLFLETVVPPFHYMPTTDPNTFQVWGKRKGHEHRRLEKRTSKEFNKNEDFLRMSRVID